jgi:uncharacterized surface protein with fasciclin (FAS1) repeats
MKREHQKSTADIARCRTIECRFAEVTQFQVTVHVHTKRQSTSTTQTMKIIRRLALTVIAALAVATHPVHADSEPGHKKDIVAVASGAGSFNTLVAAVKAAGLVETLQGPGPFTVFAPTDEAFAKLPKGTVEDLLKPENKAKLVAILTYHVVGGKVMAADVKTMKAKTVNGQSLDIKVADGAVTVDKARVVKTDVAASNGVIHVIDTVVLPN